MLRQPIVMDTGSMLTARALELVHVHRTRIDRHIDQAIELLDLPPETSRYPLAIARWRLVQMLREYHLFKKVEIFDPAIRSGSREQALLAERMLHACHSGWVAFTAYTLDWSSRDIAAAWPEYSMAMRDITERLHAHVAREEKLVTQLLEQSSRTRLLARAA